MDETPQFSPYNEVPVVELVQTFVGVQNAYGYLDSPEFADYLKWADGIPAYLRTLSVDDLIDGMIDQANKIDSLSLKLSLATE